MNPTREDIMEAIRLLETLAIFNKNECITETIGVLWNIPTPITKKEYEDFLYKKRFNEFSKHK